MAYAELLIETGTNFLYMFDWVFGFAWFIFLNTLMYEINKDIYTVEGDRENGNHTIPVKLGIRAAEGIITALAGVAMISAVLAYFVEFSASLAILIYIIFALLLPYGIYIISILSGKRKKTLPIVADSSDYGIVFGCQCIFKTFLFPYFCRLNDRIIKIRSMEYKLILASASPRRHQLMCDAGFKFEVRLKHTEEIWPEGLAVEEVPEYLAGLKAKAFDGELKEGELLITADTVVCLDAKILGKPGKPGTCNRNATSIIGKKTSGYTGVCLTTLRNTVPFLPIRTSISKLCRIRKLPVM